MRQFHTLTVTRVERETPDAIRISLAVPDALRGEFAFLPGQHLPIEIVVDGKRVRRTYSICSPPGQMPLEIGVRVQDGGQFSTHVAEHLQAGNTLDVMPPIGQFHADIDPEQGRNCVAFAAGSGITPILSIMAATLEAEPRSRFLLFYGNRRQQSTMFIDDLYALKNRFPDRVQLQFVFSREAQELPIMSGRLDEAKVRELYAAFCTRVAVDEVFVCGPDTMIETVSSTLVDLGVESSRIHAERFGVPRKRGAAAPARKGKVVGDKPVTVAIIMDGQRRTFAMVRGDTSIVDAAAGEGIELPYSCKGGVCATCRTHLRSGTVDMQTNYGLEPWELEKGFVLACQSRPTSDDLVLDYDRT